MIEFSKGDLAIGIGYMPGRVSKCITVRRGGVIYTTAYCRSSLEGDRLVEALTELTGAKPLEGEE